MAALSQKKIPVTIYYDKKGSPKIPLENAELHPISSKGLMHQKILIIDEETIFLGSANFTEASLRMHDNLIIGFKDKEVASFLMKHAPLTGGSFQRFIGGQEINLWLLPHPEALESLKKALREAKNSLDIALFTLTHPELIEELINAKNRGVDVTIIVDLHSSLGASQKGCQLLQDKGVPIFFSQGLGLMHHKFVLIDKKSLFTGSPNWTKSAFKKNQECLLYFKELTKEQIKEMGEIWKNLKIKAKDNNQ